MIGIEVRHVFVYGGIGKTNVLLTIDELETIIAVLGGGVFTDRSYLNALDIERVIKQAILSNGEIIVALNHQKKSGGENAMAALEFLFNRLEARPKIKRLRFL